MPIGLRRRMGRMFRERRAEHGSCRCRPGEHRILALSEVNCPGSSCLTAYFAKRCDCFRSAQASNPTRGSRSLSGRLMSTISFGNLSERAKQAVKEIEEAGDLDALEAVRV